MYSNASWAGKRTGGRARTVSGKDLGDSAGSLADQDGDVGVVLLHGRVGSCDEGSV